MATIDALQAITIADAAKGMPDGKMLPLYDALRRRTTALTDAVWVGASHPEYHRMNISDVAIQATLTAMYEGVPGTKKVFKQVDEYLARYEDNSLVDVRMKEHYPDILAYRNKMDTLKAKDIAWQFDKAIFQQTLGSDGKGFNGLYSRTKTATMTDGLVIKAAASSGTTTSIFFVSWHEDNAFLIHPKGSKSFGVETEDKGEVRVLDGSNNPFYAYETWLSMRGGLGLKNVKSIARISGIDTNTEDIFTSGNIMRKVNKIIPEMVTNGKVYAYLSPLGYSLLQNYIQDKTNIQYKVDEFGKQITEFAGITWRVADGIVNNESAAPYTVA